MDKKSHISRAIFISLAVGVLVGLMIGAFIMDGGWEHSPQPTCQEPGNIYWDSSLLQEFFWFVVFGGSLSLIFSLVSAGAIVFFKVLQHT